MKEVHRIEFMGGNPRRLPLYEELHELFQKHLDEEVLGAVLYQVATATSHRAEPRLITGHLFQAPLDATTHGIVRQMRSELVRPATLAEIAELVHQGGCPPELWVTALGTMYLTESGACVPSVSVRKDGNELILDQIEGPWDLEHLFLGISLSEAETPELREIH